MKPIAIFVILFAFDSCAERGGDHQKAILLHNSMIRKSHQLAQRLAELKLNPSVSQDSVRRLSDLFDSWRSSLVEVPGNPGHEQGNHQHVHNDAANVTEAQMLKIQQELDLRLSTIAKRVDQLTPTLHTEDHEQ